jgi:hypothetical protein
MEVECLGHAVGFVARGAVDEACAVALLIADRFAHEPEFRLFRHRVGGEGEVRAGCAAVEEVHVAARGLDDLQADVGDDALLGGRGHAEDLRRRRVAVDVGEAAHGIAVIGPEIVAPLGDAMRLVEDPEADAAAVESGPDGRVAQLLRRDEEHAGLAMGHLVQAPPAGEGARGCR